MPEPDTTKDFYVPIALHKSNFEELLQITFSDRDFHELKRFLSDTNVNDDIVKFAIQRIHDELPMLNQWLLQHCIQS